MSFSPADARRGRPELEAVALGPTSPTPDWSIAGLQERAARAVPAAVEEERSGCWLRYSDSDATWWAGATLVHGPSPGAAPEAVIGIAEAFYARLGSLARFQVCPACPPELDQALANRGYVRGELLSLRVRTSPSRQRHPPVGASRRAVVRSEPDGEWLSVWLATTPAHSDAAAEWELLQRVPVPSAYVTVSVAGRPVSVGRAVAEAGWTGVFNMATLTDARGLGAACAVLETLTGWAADQDAPQMYLQVDRANRAALALYGGTGFHELCTYHYRTADPRRPAEAGP